jgi:hypothetical protein
MLSSSTHIHKVTSSSILVQLLFIILAQYYTSLLGKTYYVKWKRKLKLSKVWKRIYEWVNKGAPASDSFVSNASSLNWLMTTVIFICILSAKIRMRFNVMIRKVLCNCNTLCKQCREFYTLTYYCVELTFIAICNSPLCCLCKNSKCLKTLHRRLAL